MMLLYEKIQNALVEIGRLGPFYLHTYDKDTGAVTVDTSNGIDPASIFCAEVSMQFINEPTNRRRLEREVRDWQFELRLKFERPVSLETFWMNLINQPPFIPRDDATGLRQVTLLILGGQIEHPVQQQPPTGTRVRYLFEAALAPK